MGTLAWILMPASPVPVDFVVHVVIMAKPPTTPQAAARWLRFAKGW